MNKMHENPWPARLKHAMEDADLTQQDLADLIDYSQPAVSYWLKGKKLPRPAIQEWILQRVQEEAEND